MTDILSPLPIRHIPGPYFYERDSDGCDDLWKIIVQKDQRYVATITFWGGYDKRDDAVTEANARLLTASPDMFDALKEVIEAFDGLNITVESTPIFRALRSARFAVALVEGKLAYRAC